jgi:hypothetical protein
MRGALAHLRPAALRRCTGAWPAPTLLRTRHHAPVFTGALPLPLRCLCPRPGAAGAAGRSAPPPRRAPAPRGAARPLCAAAAGDAPPPPDVQKLATMARLDVTAEEAAAWTPKINAVVDWYARARV